jgi:HSP20 family protein
VRVASSASWIANTKNFCYPHHVAKRLVHHVHTTLHLVGLSSPSSNVEWVPNTDIYETEVSFVVRMELAGVDKDEVQISLSDRTLTVRGRRPDLCRKEKCHFRQMEIHYGLFERRIIIPRTIDGRKVKANYRNGFLIIELPKIAKSSPVPLKVDIEED